ncbi:hypothetical protein [Tsuneonella sp. HG222]
MVRHSLDSVNDFARQGYYLRIRCLRPECGRDVDAHPVAMMTEHRLRGRMLQIEVLEERLKCQQCGHRGAHITPSVGT